MRPLAVAALVTSVVALAIPVLVPVALVLAVVHLRSSGATEGGRVARVAVGLAVVSLVGWGTAFLVGRHRVDDRRGGAECEAGLQALLLAQERFRSG
jgi:hypothetical protein